MNAPTQQPPHSRRMILIAALAILVVGLLASLADRAVSEWLTRADVRQSIEDALAIPLAAALYVFLLAILASFANWKRLFVGFLTPVALTALLVHALKFLVGRARPRLHLGSATFRPFQFVEGFDSFPSASSAAALTISLLLGIYFPRWRYVFYVLALLVGLERVLHEWHYLSDVLAGFAVATLCVLVCVHGLGPRYYRLESPRSDL